MNVEIVWQAYDLNKVDRAWREISVRELYREILEDDFRRKVDPRSMLFHKSQFYLLNDLELLMKRGVTIYRSNSIWHAFFIKEWKSFPRNRANYFLITVWLAITPRYAWPMTITL